MQDDFKNSEKNKKQIELALKFFTERQNAKADLSIIEEEMSKSWHKFEISMATETFLDRLIIERNALNTKVEALSLFIDSYKYTTLPKIQIELLGKQFIAMVAYLECLDLRLADLQKR